MIPLNKAKGLISTTGRGYWLFTKIHFSFLHLPASLAGRCITRLSSSLQYVSRKTCATSCLFHKTANRCFSIQSPLSGCVGGPTQGDFRSHRLVFEELLSSVFAMIAWSRTPLSNRSICPRLLTEQNMKFYCVQHNNTVDLFQRIQLIIPLLIKSR